MADWILIIVTAGYLSNGSIAVHRMTEQQCKAIVELVPGGESRGAAMRCLGPDGQWFPRPFNVSK